MGRSALLLIALICAMACTSVYKAPEIRPRPTGLLAGDVKIVFYDNTPQLAKKYGKKFEGWGTCDEFFKSYVLSQVATDRVHPYPPKGIEWIYGTTLRCRRHIRKAAVYYD